MICFLPARSSRRGNFGTRKVCICIRAEGVRYLAGLCWLYGYPRFRTMPGRELVEREATACAARAATVCSAFIA